MVADGATPTSLNFVPDVEIIVVSKKISRLHGRLLAETEEWKTHWHNATGRQLYYRPIRTADVEATMVLGAHGPRRLHLVLVDEQAPWPENR